MSSRYRAAGVDIDRARGLIAGISAEAARTKVPGVLGGIGLFSGCFALEPGAWREPVLVAGTDGVGTKILIAEQLGLFEGVGIDLVAMSVNDIITCGARPLFFLDYLAVGRLVPERELALVRGIAAGCRAAGCALLGGETAQMNDVYGKNGFDLAGFAVGIVERERLVDGSAIEPGDCLLGLPSSGLHSNGFSLVRRLFSTAELTASGGRLGQRLLEPTRIYAATVRSLLERFSVRGIAHITGGGLVDNVPRLLRPGLRAVVESGAWPVPDIFELLRGRGDIAPDELYRTFNMGIGLVLVMAPAEAEQARQWLAGRGEESYLIGRVEAAAGEPACVVD